ncbi:LuxR C-terminal-related transcriptional regulator [Pseudonocardia sp. DSM 110487]|uniref:LuxR C-terminal-related transcriptional regulator n=1 Tax=Pseudonocardia sp. DSM 110487 TaxID=2865833 RepID=UPI001C69CB59|nr:LuxR C-terminal-related transcriptional regulator [Pseudonocardia sp. DSM 110487]QYN38595.1 LuxR C-terminal-related transcriptional regulator [Pseudonocardia sp. DSM 110487]
MVKTAVPRPPPSYVPRSRLLVALDEAAVGQVTLVSAPAGYGKTLLLAEWAARLPELTAWVSLDEDDNNDRRFWAAILAALGTCAGVPADNALHDLALPGLPSRNPEFLAIVADAIGTAPGPLRLVLDDVHELTAPDPLHGLASLVRDRPPGLHVVLSGRTDPPLPLARMRLAGELSEIRADRLRFSVAEARTMLAAADVPARPDQVRLLVEETEGWAAGLRLAAVSLREAEDPDKFLAGFVGSGRAVSDYLVGEILSRLTVETRELLGAVSVCDQLAAPLAAALSGREDAGVVLDSLERETSLVLSMGEDRRWYRIHPLLRSHLRADLQRRRPDLISRLHGRAADWFAAAGQPVPALAHARQGGDAERVAQLLCQQATALIAAGEHAVVREALEQLGDVRLGSEPRLALVAALVATEAGAIAAADAHLADAASWWPPDPPPDLLALRNLVRSRRAIVAGDPSPRTTDETGFGAAAHLGLGAMAMLHDAIGLLADGRHHEARDVAETALAQARQQHHIYLVALGLIVLGAIAAAEGDYRRMTTLASAADAELADSTWRATIGAAWSSTMRAYGALLRAEPAACLALAPTEIPGGSPPQLSDQLVVLRTALRGAAMSDIGHSDQGLNELREARGVAAGRPGAAEIPAIVALLEHRAATVQGHGSVARTVLRWAEDELGPVGEVLLLRARQLAGLGRPRAAGDALVRLLDGAVPVVLPWTLVEGRVLGCQLALRGERRPQARRELDHALALSETMDVLRPLATGPPEVIDLLTRHLGSFGDRETTALRVLAARNALGTDTQPVSLTDRERAVLTMLPTQRSFDEIALDLTVSHSTVKTHVRALYGKLGVNSRRDAVAAARRRGILAPDPP